MFDGIRLALSAPSELVRAGLTLESWRHSMPLVYRRSRSVEVPASETGRVLSAFAGAEKDAAVGGGVRFEREDGWGWVCPDEQRPAFHIVTESASAEFARELCDFCERELRRLAGT